MRTIFKPGKWKAVQLPEDIIKAIDEVISTEGLGYTSRSEFIKETVRMRIQALKKSPK